MRLALLATFLCLGSLAFAATASADVKDSANWSGYAVHRPGVTFRKVSGTWIQPSATCVQGEPTYSAFWIGIGGFSLTAPALEQVGTELDCTASGAIKSTAWYELVPARSKKVTVNVRPGDAVRATVTVRGHWVTVTLADLSTGRSFHRTAHARLIDASSAEWIAEAPSVCRALSDCQTLPLANFGTATFASARAQSTSGRVGTITASAWRRTMIRLLPGGRHFVVGASGSSAAEATPSAPAAGGSRFTVNYSDVALHSNRATRASQAAVTAGRLVH
jgi:hypothetical protein